MRRWHYAQGKQKFGPCTFEQLQQRAAAGQLKPSDMILEEGVSRWTAAAALPGLFAAPAAPAPIVPGASLPPWAIASVGGAVAVLLLVLASWMFFGRTPAPEPEFDFHAQVAAFHKSAPQTPSKANSAPGAQVPVVPINPPPSLQPQVGVAPMPMPEVAPPVNPVVDPPLNVGPTLGPESPVLAPTKMRLQFQEVLLDEAITELSKKIGSFIFLDDPERKIRNRKITLDTGLVTFWEAFDQFRVKAGLVEGLPQVALAPQKLPALPPTPAPGEPIPLIGIGDGTPMFRVIRGVITLKDGKPRSLPTDYSTAVRIQPSLLFIPPSSQGEMVVSLKVNPEPKLRWQDVVEVRVDRAIDEHGQQLQAAKKPPASKFGKFGGGEPGTVGSDGFPLMGNDNVANVSVRLQKGDKASTLLKELRGVLSARVSAYTREVLVINDMRAGAGQRFKGEMGSSMMASSMFTDAQRDINFDLELDVPPQFLEAEKPGFNIYTTPLPGLKVFDAAGNAIPVLSMTRSNAPTAANAYAVKVRPNQGQTPTRLVYFARETVTLAIPFTLKDVPVR